MNNFATVKNTAFTRIAEAINIMQNRYGYSIGDNVFTNVFECKRIELCKREQEIIGSLYTVASYGLITTAEAEYLAEVLRDIVTDAIMKCHDAYRESIGDEEYYIQDFIGWGMTREEAEDFMKD